MGKKSTIISWRIKRGLALIAVAVIPFISTISIQAVQNSRDPATLFHQANRYYNERNYVEAASIYTKLIDAGYESGNLYYNLGNAQLKLGNKGWAILYYNKAMRFLPGDADLQKNLKLAQTGLAESDTEIVARWRHAIAYLAPLDVLTGVSSALFFIFMALLCIRILRSNVHALTQRKRLGHGWLVFSAVALALSSTVTWISATEIFSNKGIVVTTSVKACYQPNQSSAACFTLPEGSRVQIDKEEGSWSLIRWRGGKRGWIPTGAYRKI